LQNDERDVERAAHQALLRDTDMDLREAERRIRLARLKIAAAERKYKQRLTLPGA
jgi:hypothetical protein